MQALLGPLPLFPSEVMLAYSSKLALGYACVFPMAQHPPLPVSLARRAPSLSNASLRVDKDASYACIFVRSIFWGRGAQVL